VFQYPNYGILGGIKLTDTNKHYERAIQPIEYIQCTLNDYPETPFEGAAIKDIIKNSRGWG